MECPAITCPKQAISEAATAIAEGKNEAASEILTRLAQVANVKGTSEQRLTAYMTSALRSRVSPVEYPPPVSELHTKEHHFSTHKLYEASPCFKLGFMAANLAILHAVSDQRFCKLHVIDFDIGDGGRYLHLLYALAARKAENPTVLKITTFADVPGGDQQLRAVEEELQKQAQTAGVCLSINVMPCSNTELMSQQIPDSLRSKLNSGTRGNPGFTITEQAGGIGFGWMGRTLAVASAWR